ncbi:hypothetical protein PCLA_05r0079 [Pseudomonas citronellolis]|nr:hypothetical protein PCLA_05r0079 [Pseudomonas citronellolis]
MMCFEFSRQQDIVESNGVARERIDLGQCSAPEGFRHRRY